MRIISKYKDYYDYLMGINGIDNKVVLDRRGGYIVDISTSDIESDEYEDISLAICGKLYRGLYNRKGFFWMDEAKKCGEYTNLWFDGWVVQYKDHIYTHVQTIDIEVHDTTINNEENCPIVRVHGRDDQHRELFPLLRDLSVARFYPPEKIYNDLYNWIIERNMPNIKDNRSDVEKLQSAGFDKVISFRNIK